MKYGCKRTLLLVFRAVGSSLQGASTRCQTISRERLPLKQRYCGPSVAVGSELRLMRCINFYAAPYFHPTSRVRVQLAIGNGIILGGENRLINPQLQQFCIFIFFFLVFIFCLCFRIGVLESIVLNFYFFAR